MYKNRVSIQNRLLNTLNSEKIGFYFIWQSKNQIQIRFHFPYIPCSLDDSEVIPILVPRIYLASLTWHDLTHLLTTNNNNTELSFTASNLNKKTNLLLSFPTTPLSFFLFRFTATAR